ncbi:MAG: ferrous iron transport protein A [Fibrobacter sp.]|jgi:ferrous iron transport protein A|nr:ferrous iron transport protein A [Fibrobacter sp.]
MCLTEMKENQKGLIHKINGDSRFVSRVVSMGLPPSSQFLVLQNDGRSPILVYSHDTMIAINRKECSQIEVAIA